MANIIPTLDTIVAEAVEITDDAQRSKYVAEASGDDAPLRLRAMALIQAHFEADRFLAEPTTLGHAECIDPTGDSMGPYRLLERIGEGGMGIVYVAEQSVPIHRRVALKIVKPGMDSREVVARFGVERQALALMDHPNIAKVFDAGADAAGRPYFVMELVRGLPITKHCDDARLCAARRLQLFLQVCRAVQHAHQKGIIHRDIKPSNILVTMQDGVAVPKVIDFGVAKAMNHQFAANSAYTRFTQLIGTPLYMSPEQAELSAEDVDTRSDVYSLGVLLYELLTGTTPFDPQAIQDADFDEMRRIIREDEPLRPSARLSTLDAKSRSTASSQRGLDDRQLSRLLSGDLDWIVMKALEKDRNRRYESAGAFAADIERYLAHEPVEARPPSAIYRMGKFVRRNRGKLAAAMVLLAATLAVVGTVGWNQWDTARRQAKVEQAVVDALAEADRLEEQGKWSEARAAVERAAAVLHDVKRTDVEERRQIHRLLHQLANVEMQNEATTETGFNWDQKTSSYKVAFLEFGVKLDNLETSQCVRRLPAGPVRNEIVAALDDWARLLRLRHPREQDWRRVLAIARAAETDAWRQQLRSAWEAGWPDGRKNFQELIDAAPVDELHPFTLQLAVDYIIRMGDASRAIQFLEESVRRRPAQFSAYNSLARRLINAKPPRIDEALGYYRAALALQPDSPGAYLNVGETLASLERTDEAIAMYKEALRLKPNYSAALNNLGISYVRKGDLVQAEKLIREAIRILPDNPAAQRNLGVIRFRQKDFQEAARCYKEAIRLKPTDATAQLYYGKALDELGQKAEAFEATKQALRLNPNYWDAHYTLGKRHFDQEQFDDAIASYRRAIQLKPSNTTYISESLAALHTDLGFALCQKKLFDESIVEFREALRIDKNFAHAFYGLAGALAEKGKLDESVHAMQEAIRLDSKRADYHYSLGTILLGRQQYDMAIAPFREALRLDPQHAQAFCNLGYVLKQTGQYRDALTAYRRGHELGSKDPEWKFPSAQWVKECEALLEESEKSKPAEPAPDKPPSLD